MRAFGRAVTSAQAVAKFQDLLAQRRKEVLPVLKRTPKFADNAEQYFDYYRQVKDAKRESTLAAERFAIDRLSEHLGHVRQDRIYRALINSYIAKRQGAGRSGRPVNLEVTCFRNVIKRAVANQVRNWVTARLPSSCGCCQRWARSR